MFSVGSSSFSRRFRIPPPPPPPSPSPPLLSSPSKKKLFKNGMKGRVVIFLANTAVKLCDWKPIFPPSTPIVCRLAPSQSFIWCFQSAHRVPCERRSSECIAHTACGLGGCGCNDVSVNRQGCWQPVLVSSSSQVTAERLWWWRWCHFLFVTSYSWEIACSDGADI